MKAVIRVGTTGDYPPVTDYDAGTGAFCGQDIALIEEFAQDQGLRLEFVLTSWPGLLADLCAGKFEIAVGGISRTEERQKLALLSRPLAITGKVALVRRGEEQRYASSRRSTRRKPRWWRTTAAPTSSSPAAISSAPG